MMTSNKRNVLILTSVLLIATGCASPAFDAENENAARNRGAVGGALIGATMGALMGGATLAVQGAALGGVAGGVSGSMKDLQDSREADPNQVLADGVSQDTRSDAERRVAELEAEIKLLKLEQQLADMETELEKSAPINEES